MFLTMVASRLDMHSTVARPRKANDMTDEKRSLDHFKRIYRDRADAFHQLVMAEDCDGHLLPAVLAALAPAAAEQLDALDVVEIGAGTGRVTGLLAVAGVRSILGTDQSAGMLAVAREHLAALTAKHGLQCDIELLQSDFNDGIPAPENSADLVIGGWVFGHMTEWFTDSWRPKLAQVLTHTARVIRPGGTEIIVETLGSGSLTPNPPTSELAEFYECLEAEHGFVRQTIATDYRFDSVADAVRVCGSFFGDEFGQRVRDMGWAQVPEWTGVWSRTTPSR